jgi:hypothetical protein
MSLSGVMAGLAGGFANGRLPPVCIEGGGWCTSCIFRVIFFKELTNGDACSFDPADTRRSGVFGMGRVCKDCEEDATEMEDGLLINVCVSTCARAIFCATSRSSCCCLNILSTAFRQSIAAQTRYQPLDLPLYPLLLRAARSVERIVINKSASLALGDSNNRRHKDVATLRIGMRREYATAW